MRTGMPVLPLDLSPKDFPHLPATFQKYPELLLGLILSIPAEHRFISLAHMGIEEDDVENEINLFHSLIYDGDEYDIKLFLENCHALTVDPIIEMEEEVDDNSPIYNIHAIKGALLDSIQKDTRNRSEPGITNIFIGILYFCHPLRRDEIFRLIRFEFRKLLCRQMPDLITIKIEENQYIKIDEIPDWLNKLGIKQSKIESNLQRLQKKNEALRANIIKLQKQKSQGAPKTTTIIKEVIKKQESAEMLQLKERISILEKNLKEEQQRRSAIEQENQDLLDDFLEDEDHPEEKQERISISGKRILIVGGLDRSEIAVEEALAAEGATLVNEDRSSKIACSKIKSADIVVIKTRRINHATSDAVKTECSKLNVPLRHWTKADPETLIRLLTTPQRQSSENTSD
jgi:hypothetical protein